MKTLCFEYENDKLVNLVLEGKKRAVSFLHKKDLPKINKEYILVYDNEKEACKIRINEIIVTEFKNIPSFLIKLEGFNSYEEWKDTYLNHFKMIDKHFKEEDKITFIIFEMTENLVLKRLEIAKKIANNNKDLFGKISSIKEINAGFNNSIFDINNKYIIKVCNDSSDEHLFDVETKFYEENKNNKSIPKLYRYDKSKTYVPFVYEIIEKVNGKSVYYYWYKMNESKRENFIKDLMLLIKKLHKKEYPSYDWAFEVKKEVLDNYNKCLELFNNEEQNIINESLSFYDEILSDNKFVFTHNDLHFDNILIDNKSNIKLIDFNDAKVAPFDYDLRILYMCVERPWKWANIEMDPYQKQEDYQNIFEYVKKYYKELKNVKYLEERMYVYCVLNDIRHLYKYNEVKDIIIRNSKLIIDRMKEYK